MKELVSYNCDEQRFSWTQAAYALADFIQGFCQKFLMDSSRCIQRLLVVTGIR